MCFSVSVYGNGAASAIPAARPLHSNCGSNGAFCAIWYILSMVSQTKTDHVPPSIVPIDDETHAMLDYAESAEARSKFEQARHELRNGEGITPTAEYFADLNQRISERVKNSDRKKGA
jgi:hypothetical protein